MLILHKRNLHSLKAYIIGGILAGTLLTTAIDMAVVLSADIPLSWLTNGIWYSWVMGLMISLPATMSSWLIFRHGTR
jgi:hypothetical protein